jgi:hypothetical protein
MKSVLQRAAIAALSKARGRTTSNREGSIEEQLRLANTWVSRWTRCKAVAFNGKKFASWKSEIEATRASRAGIGKHFYRFKCYSTVWGEFSSFWIVLWIVL